MLRRTNVVGLIALCSASVVTSACGPIDAWAADPEPRELAPAILSVRQTPAEAISSALMPALIAAPKAASDGSEARPFESLRAALSMAPAGALLRVEEGIWREQLIITRAVVLMGRGAGRTRLIPPEGTGIAIDVRGADHVQLHGLSVEGAAVGVHFAGGAGHRLESVELHDLSEAAVKARGAEVSINASSVREVAGGKSGRGLDVEGGALEVRRVSFKNAGRRAIVVSGAAARLDDLEVSGSAMAAVQALDKADVHVLRGEFEGQGGASLYAGAARLSVEDAHIRHNEYGIIAARGAELSAIGNEITDYHVAGVALVRAHGTVQRTQIARGGTEAAISITMADGKTPVLLVDNRIQSPGTMGVHVTGSSVTARGNTITGAWPDREKDMGDAFYVLESRLVVEENVMRGNSGSGLASIRSTVRFDGNGLIGNGRAGLLLLDRSKGTASGNLFQRNAFAAVEVGELASATLSKNRFEGNPRLDIDTGCGKGLTGTADLQAGNTFATPLRRRACVE